ncbi:AAA family ATPase [Tenacibaculum aiptasiae]|uniref:AAA family ATPase n=1 Tax=Tenacibaculum aiptasiae TaxID=426481 RepID=UPI003B58E1D0
MIKQIGFKNYKAFKEGKIKIKPITILLGSNSAGKSSLIQLFLMLSQTYSSRKNRKNSLMLNGNLVNLGESKNIFHNKRTKLGIELSFDFDNVDYETIYELVKDHILSLYRSLERVYSMFSTEEELSKKRRIKFYKLSREFEDISDFEEVFKRLSSLKRKINIKAKDISHQDFENILNIYFEPEELSEENKIYSKSEKKIIIDFAQYKNAYSFINKLNEINPKSANITYLIKRTKDNLEISGFKVSSGESNLLSYEHKKRRKGKRDILSSDLLDEKTIEKYSSKFGKMIDLTNIEIATKRIFFRQKTINNFFINILIEFIEFSSSPVKDSLSYRNINYINPLRAYPKRYYFQDEVINSSGLSTIDSLHLIDLFKDRTDIKKNVNKWLKKFNINLDIAQLEEVIHKIKVNHSGLHLDITDVGFGISQIIPIIAQSYIARKNSITLIEQPEIHLHPKMQADLADLFIQTSQFNNNRKHFVIETHSEYLLKRLRRRISEGGISANDVGIYFINGKNEERNFATIDEIEISDSGSFQWPKDFYADDLEDTMEFLKNQAK